MRLLTQDTTRRCQPSVLDYIHENQTNEKKRKKRNKVRVKARKKKKKMQKMQRKCNALRPTIHHSLPSNRNSKTTQKARPTRPTHPLVSRQIQEKSRDTRHENRKPRDTRHENARAQRSRPLPSRRCPHQNTQESEKQPTRPTHPLAFASNAEEKQEKTTLAQKARQPALHTLCLASQKKATLCHHPSRRTSMSRKRPEVSV